MNTWRNPLPAPLEPYAAESRADAQALAVTVPRCHVAPAPTSVNQAPRNRVGSRLADQSVPARCHHARARVCNADTHDDPWFHPPDAPAPTPTPQSGAAHSSSPMAYGASVSIPAVRELPVHPASRPRRIPSERGGVVNQPSLWPRRNHSPCGRAASVPPALRVSVGAVYESVGPREATPMLEPPG